MSLWFLQYKLFITALIIMCKVPIESLQWFRDIFCFYIFPLFGEMQAANKTKLCSGPAPPVHVGV